MVACHDHQRFQYYLLVASFLHCCQDVIQAWRRLHGTHIVIPIACLREHVLHFCVYLVRICHSAMSHEADSCLAVIIPGSCLCDGLHHCPEIIICGEKRLSDCHFLKCIRILRHLIDQIRILKPVHQMGRLNHKIPDAVLFRAVKGLAHIVNGNVIPGFYVVNNNLAGKSSSYGKVRKCLLNSVLNGQTSAVIVAGTKADYQKFIFTNLILIPGIILRCIPGIVILLVRLGSRFCGLFCCLRCFRLCRCCCLSSGRCLSLLGCLCGRFLLSAGTAGRGHCCQGCRRK